MTALNKKLFVGALVAGIACAVSFLPFARNPSAPKAFDSALLNPSHRDDVTEIVIMQEMNFVQINDPPTLTLKKVVPDGQKEAWWTASDGLTTVRADKKLIENVLKNIISVRKMYIISDKFETGKKTTPSHQALIIRNDDTSYTKIDFFDTNTLTNRIMFGVESANSLFETADNFSQFLQTNVRYWAKPELVQTVDEPVLFVWKETGCGAVTVAQYSPDFASVAHDVMALRHGAVVHTQKSLQGQTAVLTIGAGEYRERIFLCPQDDGSYRCEYAFVGTPSPSDALHFAFEISGWTYERLQKIFAER